MQMSSDRLVINRSKVRDFFVILVCMALIIGCIFFIQEFEYDAVILKYGFIELPPISAIFFKILVGFVGAFFILAIIMLIKRLKKGLPEAILDKQGVALPASNVSLITWDQITRYGSYKIHSNYQVGFDIADSETYLADKSFWKRKLLQSSINHGYPLIGFQVSKKEAQKVIDFMDKMCA